MNIQMTEQSGRPGMNARAVLALEQGWTVIPNENGRNHGADSFVRGKTHVWMALSSSGTYTRADLIDGKYINHKRFNSFPEAIGVKLNGCIQNSVHTSLN